MTDHSVVHADLPRTCRHGLTWCDDCSNVPSHGYGRPYACPTCGGTIIDAADQRGHDDSHAVWVTAANVQPGDRVKRSGSSLWRSERQAREDRRPTTWHVVESIARNGNWRTLRYLDGMSATMTPASKLLVVSPPQREDGGTGRPLVAGQLRRHEGI